MKEETRESIIETCWIVMVLALCLYLHARIHRVEIRIRQIEQSIKEAQ